LVNDIQQSGAAADRLDRLLVAEPEPGHGARLPKLASSDSSTEYEFFRNDLAAKTQVNAAPQGLNLEAGDAITVQAATGSNVIQGAISYAQIDRSQENG
jgi:hypothetical protein